MGRNGGDDFSAGGGVSEGGGGREGGGGDGSERGVEEERLQAAWDDTRQATTGLGDGDAAEADVWRR